MNVVIPIMIHWFIYDVLPTYLALDFPFSKLKQGF